MILLLLVVVPALCTGSTEGPTIGTPIDGASSLCAAVTCGPDTVCDETTGVAMCLSRQLDASSSISDMDFYLSMSDDSNENEQCGENEELLKCGHCDRFCDGRLIKCSSECAPTCNCLDGYFRDDHGKCVLKEHCTPLKFHDAASKVKKVCASGEQWYSCKPCDKVCGQTNKNCDEFCDTGCACSNDHVRNAAGACVTEEGCHKSSTQLRMHNNVTAATDIEDSLDSELEDDFPFPTPPPTLMPVSWQTTAAALNQTEILSMDRSENREIVTHVLQEHHVPVESWKNFTDDVMEVLNRTITTAPENTTSPMTTTPLATVVQHPAKEVTTKSQKNCPPNERWYECQPCDLCTQILDKVCEKPCVPGCGCARKHRRYPNGQCVRISVCRQVNRARRMNAKRFRTSTSPKQAIVNRTEKPNRAVGSTAGVEVVQLHRSNASTSRQPVRQVSQNVMQRQMNSRFQTGLPRRRQQLRLATPNATAATMTPTNLTNLPVAQNRVRVPSRGQMPMGRQQHVSASNRQMHVLRQSSSMFRRRPNTQVAHGSFRNLQRLPNAAVLQRTTVSPPSPVVRIQQRHIVDSQGPTKMVMRGRSQGVGSTMSSRQRPMRRNNMRGRMPFHSVPTHNAPTVVHLVRSSSTPPHGAVIISGETTGTSVALTRRAFSATSHTTSTHDSAAATTVHITHVAQSSTPIRRHVVSGSGHSQTPMVSVATGLPVRTLSRVTTRTSNQNVGHIATTMRRPMRFFRNGTPAHVMTTPVVRQHTSTERAMTPSTTIHSAILSTTTVQNTPSVTAHSSAAPQPQQQREVAREHISLPLIREPPSVLKQQLTKSIVETLQQNLKGAPVTSVPNNTSGNLTETVRSQSITVEKAEKVNSEIGEKTPNIALISGASLTLPWGTSEQGETAKEKSSTNVFDAMAHQPLGTPRPPVKERKDFNADEIVKS